MAKELNNEDVKNEIDEQELKDSREAFDDREIYENEEELLEPDVTPPSSNMNKWIIVALLALVLVLGAGIGYYYYNASKDTSGEDMYKAQLTTYYNSYVQAQQDYFTALNQQFASYEETSAHVFTDEDLVAIKGATDMFEQRANEALDNIIAAEAPSHMKKTQKEVADAAKNVKETVVLASVKSQRDIKAGQTMQDFIDESETYYEKENDKVSGLFEKFQEALSKAGLDMSAAEEQSQ